MAELHFNFLNHIIKGLKGKLNEDEKNATITQLAEIINKDKDEIKIKAGSKGLAPGEIRS